MVDLGGKIQVDRTFDRGRITVRLLLFPDTPHQSIQSQNAVLRGPGPDIPPEKTVREEGNRFAIFHLTRPGTYEYDLKANIKTDRQPSSGPQTTASLSADQRKRWIASTKHVEAGDARISRQSETLLTEESFLKNLHRVTKWVHDHVQYDRQFYPQTLSAVDVLRRGRGVCDEFSALAGALFRSGGIPVRFVSGVVFSGSSWGNHAWMEAFQPDVGWTPVDPTYQEAIVLDGTHIRRGHFEDPEGNSLSVRVRSRSSTVSNIRITQHEPEIEVLETRTFQNLIDVDARDVTFPARQWVSLNVGIESRASTPIIVPVLFRRIRNLQIRNRTTSLLINGNQSSTVAWNIRIDRQLPERARMEGTYELITMANPVKRSFNVLPESLANASTELVYDGGPPTTNRKQSALDQPKTDKAPASNPHRSEQARTNRPEKGPWLPGWVPTSWSLEPISPVRLMYALLGVFAFLLAVVYLRRS